MFDSVIFFQPFPNALSKSLFVSNRFCFCRFLRTSNNESTISKATLTVFVVSTCMVALFCSIFLCSLKCSFTFSFIFSAKAGSSITNTSVMPLQDMLNSFSNCFMFSISVNWDFFDYFFSISKVPFFSVKLYRVVNKLKLALTPRLVETAFDEKGSWIVTWGDGYVWDCVASFFVFDNEVGGDACQHDSGDSNRCDTVTVQIY